jgi:hypothetical protein
MSPALPFAARIFLLAKLIIYRENPPEIPELMEGSLENEAA